MSKRKDFVHLILGLAFSALFSGLAVAAGSLSLSPSYLVMGVPVSTVSQSWMEAIFDSDGSGPALPGAVPAASVTWSSDNPSVVSVAANGTITALSNGTAVITASYSGVSSTATIKVAGTLQHASLSTTNGTRSYYFYVPAIYTSANPAPLVFDLHGLAGDGPHEMRASRLNVVSDQAGFVAIYPESVGIRWNTGCCGANESIDDVGFIRQIIDDVKAHVTVKTSQVYATGISNGAVMVQRLGCELSDKLTAIAPVAGGLNFGGNFTTCAPLRPMPIIEFHGTTDGYYPYNGGPGNLGATNFTSIPDTIQGWVNRDQLSAGTQTQTYQKGISTCETTSSPMIDAKVTLCTQQPPVAITNSDGAAVDGGGHVHPDGSMGLYHGADFPTPDIFAAQAMWDFFKNFSLLTSTSAPPAPQNSDRSVNMARPRLGGSISIVFSTDSSAHVSAKVVDRFGQLVRRLDDSEVQPGSNTVVWNGRNGNNEIVAPGVYLILIDVNGHVQRHKCVILS